MVTVVGINVAMTSCFLNNQIGFRGGMRNFAKNGLRSLKRPLTIQEQKTKTYTKISSVVREEDNGVATSADEIGSNFRPLAAIMEDLTRRAPPRAIKVRKGKDGVQLKYIPWYHANRILSYFAPGWTGEVRNIFYDPTNKTVTVVYRITIQAAECTVFRESTGTADLDDNEFGDPIQKAEGMAFRRACSRFGLGLYLYDDDDKA